MNNKTLNRNYLNVPIGIKYISDWQDFYLPQGHIIVNKIVTGCGFTEYCLNNNIPTILCSPRKVLLENKYEQHKTKGRPTYLFLYKYVGLPVVLCCSNILIVLT